MALNFLPAAKCCIFPIIPLPPKKSLNLPENEMINSGIVVGTVSNTFIGALQIAPDGKIYVSKFDSTISVPFIGSKYLAAINYPEKRGIDCQFVDNDLYLGNGSCIWGLPTFVQSYFFQIQNFNIVSICSGDTTRFELANTVDLNKVLWDFDDPASGSLNLDTTFNPTHVYQNGGEYQVKLISYFAANTDTLVKTIVINQSPILDLGPDRNFCSNDPLLLDAGNHNSTYLWQDRSTDSTFKVLSSGDFYVTVTNDFQCKTSDSVSLMMVESPEVELGNDTILNVGDSIVFRLEPNYDAYQWSNGSTEDHLTVTQPGTYWVNAELNGCSTSDNVTIYFESHCQVYCPNAFTPNGDGKNDTFQTFSNEPLSSYHLIISSRWGTIVYKSSNLNDSWDGSYQGQQVELGVYAWIIEYQCQYSSEQKVLKGTVIVLK
jgi:gliding motility-associated-like protein